MTHSHEIALLRSVFFFVFVIRFQKHSQANNCFCVCVTRMLFMQGNGFSFRQSQDVWMWCDWKIDANHWKENRTNELRVQRKYIQKTCLYIHIEFNMLKWTGTKRERERERVVGNEQMEIINASKKKSVFVFVVASARVQILSCAMYRIEACNFYSLCLTA